MTDAELKWVAEMMSNPIWKKVRVRVQYQLVHNWLNSSMVTDDFRRGYLACLQTVDEFEVAPEEEEDEGDQPEMTDMVFLDDE